MPHHRPVAWASNARIFSVQMSYRTSPGSMSTVASRSTADCASWISPLPPRCNQGRDEDICCHGGKYQAAAIDLFLHHRPDSSMAPPQVTVQRSVLRDKAVDHRDCGPGVPLPDGDVSNLRKPVPTRMHANRYLDARGRRPHSIWLNQMRRPRRIVPAVGRISVI